ncbi:protein HEADING DATE 3B-like [Bidens hawaiensis]|uniref:protein HEADING DATE 3B-like n=1 Tax=Bidens hawaiensis TaxID=980011 RepID=UPI004049FEA2
MGNMKDDQGKKMDPLFPRLHISDADKGGPRTPPRNKMAISQQFNVPNSQRCISRSVSPVLPLSTNNGSRFVPSTSSYHDANYKRSTISTFGRSCGSTRLATRLDSYHSSGINLNISLTTVKQTMETTSCQTLCNTGHPKPQDFRTARNNNTIVKKLEFDDDYMVPSFTYENGQRNRGSFPNLSANVYQKQLKLTDKDATTHDISTTTYKDMTREPTTCYNSDRGRFSEILNEGVSSSIKRSVLIDEQQMLCDPGIRLPLKRKSFQDNMVYKDGTKKIWTLLGDNKKMDRDTHEGLAPINKSEEDHGSLHLGDAEKINDGLGTDFLSEFNINPGEVSQIISREQYCMARRTIIQQQRVFQSQLFELHRIIKVQKILAKSPDLLIVDAFYKLKKSPSEDMFPHLNHQKGNNEIEKIYNPNLIDLPPPPPPPPTNGGKQPPWCFLPQPPLGNQWLVPVRSPSEGLVYKPLAGPSPPPVGLMPSVYGMSLAPSNTDFLTNGYNIPTSYQQGISVFPSTSLLTSEVVEAHLMKGKKMSFLFFQHHPWFKIQKCPEEKGSDEPIKVIKVVPHNPKLASESAARIFQLIQEERKHNE